VSQELAYRGVQIGRMDNGLRVLFNDSAKDAGES